MTEKENNVEWLENNKYNEMLERVRITTTQ